MAGHAMVTAGGTLPFNLARAYASNTTSNSITVDQTLTSTPSGDGYVVVNSGNVLTAIFIGQGADNDDFHVHFDGIRYIGKGQYLSIPLIRVAATLGTATGDADVVHQDERTITENDRIADTITVVSGQPAWADRMIVSPADNQVAMLSLRIDPFDFIRCQLDIDAGSNAPTNANVIWGMSNA